jgi:hypothetical protein
MPTDAVANAYSARRLRKQGEQNMMWQHVGASVGVSTVKAIARRVSFPLLMFTYPVTPGQAQVSDLRSMR